MFIITHVKELGIWITDQPFNKKSGHWYFFDITGDPEFDRELYEDALKAFKKKYSSKFLFTLSTIEKKYKSRGETNEENS